MWSDVCLKNSTGVKVQQRSTPSELQKQNPELWLGIRLFLAGRLFDFMPVENINFHGLKIYLNLNRTSCGGRRAALTTPRRTLSFTKLQGVLDAHNKNSS
ncbi:hypothetical protein EYF80_025777 [Liparis tanakae]|uniref:Uncharacterized protein n=1 Tax=Liparis tanakae TaxID=230148 RepID=A0A4Z2HGK4_9TELE|nr:hypothetical protein EYF80_025777 [Liparis tanakae]